MPRNFRAPSSSTRTSHRRVSRPHRTASPTRYLDLSHTHAYSNSSNSTTSSSACSVEVDTEVDPFAPITPLPGARFNIHGPPPTARKGAPSNMYTDLEDDNGFVDAGGEVDIEDDWVDPVAPPPSGSKGKAKNPVPVPSLHYTFPISVEDAAAPPATTQEQQRNVTVSPRAADAYGARVMAGRRRAETVSEVGAKSLGEPGGSKSGPKGVGIGFKTRLPGIGVATKEYCFGPNANLKSKRHERNDIAIEAGVARYTHATLAPIAPLVARIQEASECHPRGQTACAMDMDEREARQPHRSAVARRYLPSAQCIPSIAASQVRRDNVMRRSREARVHNPRDEHDVASAYPSSDAQNSRIYGSARWRDAAARGEYRIDERWSGWKRDAGIAVGRGHEAPKRRVASRARQDWR
ncbi:hypothetical protein DFH09DRAFT_1087840 [Mycena vulgaris]|nr:hypothetical protein DFH09DRAFT_1087840 [Mycena vulgaris]